MPKADRSQGATESLLRAVDDAEETACPEPAASSVEKQTAMLLATLILAALVVLTGWDAGEAS